MKTISAKELSSVLTAEPASRVIDVRTPVEYDGAHVKEAENIPLDGLSPYALVNSGQLPDDVPVYILCQSGARAKKAAERFVHAGYGNAVVVDGGTEAWIRAGLPVERGESRVIGLERQVRIGAGSLVVTGVLLGWLMNPLFFGLSGFVGAWLVFAGITDWCGMGLLLAKAPWNRRLPK